IVRSLPFAAANLSVGLFNSLPVLSLDGGQLLWLLLCRRCTPATAEKVVNALTFACILPLAALGFWLLLRERNVSLLFVSAYLTAALLNRENRFF
ncbi:MAG: peptidase M50, partial [Ruminococcus sp.]|nr:peptidase M50 [Ruminococcus sp.]